VTNTTIWLPKRLHKGTAAPVHSTKASYV